MNAVHPYHLSDPLQDQVWRCVCKNIRDYVWLILYFSIYFTHYRILSFGGMHSLRSLLLYLIPKMLTCLEECRGFGRPYLSLSFTISSSVFYPCCSWFCSRLLLLSCFFCVQACVSLSDVEYHLWPWGATNPLLLAPHHVLM